MSLIKILVGMFLMWLLLTLLHTTTNYFIGEGKLGSHRDERQKGMFRDAVISSWEGIIFYVLYKLIYPVIIIHVMHEKLDHSISNSLFFTRGVDILLVAVLGYMIGFFRSYRKYS